MFELYVISCELYVISCYVCNTAILIIQMGLIIKRRIIHY